jgi:hypothetical protein
MSSNSTAQATLPITETTELRDRMHDIQSRLHDLIEFRDALYAEQTYFQAELSGTKDATVHSLVLGTMRTRGWKLQEIQVRCRTLVMCGR